MPTVADADGQLNLPENCLEGTILVQALVCNSSGGWNTVLIPASELPGDGLRGLGIYSPPSRPCKGGRNINDVVVAMVEAKFTAHYIKEVVTCLANHAEAK